MRDNWYTTLTIDSWESLQEEYERRFALRGRRWVFRGHQHAGWELKSSLERAVCDRFGLPSDGMPAIEADLLIRFQRNLHRFRSRVPPDDDTLEWFALMQHHGAPTRLLDCTYSLYIALFFAVESAAPGSTCAVWAVDQVWLFNKLSERDEAERAFRIDPDLRSSAACQAVLKCRARTVAPLVPYYVNERLAVQQGVFLVPLDISVGFMENLRGVATPEELRMNLFKLEIPVARKTHNQMLMSLDRLNVQRLSLFPGIDGFAQSLQLGPLWWHPDSYRE